METLLKLYGICGDVLRWFRSCFLGHRQGVRINVDGERVDLVLGKTTTGVPQGSIMGPLFFILFTTDLYVLKYIKLYMSTK